MRETALRFRRVRLGCRTALLLVLSAACAPSQPYDLVLLDGRVIDPESGLDDVRHVGVRDGVIARVSQSPIEGKDTIDASNRVVTPGFIDLNTYEHGDPIFRLRARDGVTTVLNLEDGAADVDAYYAALEGRALIHYGAGVDHETLRDLAAGDTTIRVEGGVNAARGIPAIDQRPLSPGELDRLKESVRTELEKGAVGLGFGLYYTPGATHDEVLQVSRVAAEFGVPVHVHTRAFDPVRDWDELYEPLGLAVAAGVPVHLKHLQSTFGGFTAPALEILERAIDRGLPVSTECYPYTAGLTFIESAPFDGFQEWPEEEFAYFEWPPTGERLTRASFARYRAQGGVVVIHPRDPARQEEAVRQCLADPMTMVASDGAWDDGQTHPRSAGTNSRVLGRYVRDEGLMSLPEAIRKMSLAPARHLQEAVPGMARKGRVQVGMDADLVVLDADRILDQATYREPLLPPLGIDRVIVAGVVVVDRGTVVPNAFPGRPVRRERAR